MFRQSKPTRLSVIALLTLVVSAGEAGLSGSLAQTRWTPELVEKLKPVDAVIKVSGPIPVQDLVDTIRKGLGDPDKVVREHALWAVAARAVGVKGVANWRAERPAFVQLRPDVARLLEDPSADVRTAAVKVICSLEIDQERVGPSSRQLSSATASALAARFGLETTDNTRAHLVYAFAGYGVPPSFATERNALVAKALGDPALSVLHSGVLVVAEQRIAVLIPSLVTLLTHPSPQIQTSASHALLAFGPDARAYLPVLQKALENQSDDFARRTLADSIQRISKGKPNNGA